MQVVLSVPLFVGFATVVFVALLLLKRTRLFWLPGMALTGYGLAIYFAWPWYEAREDVGFEGLSNVLHVLVTFVVVAGGAVCLLVGARAYHRARAARRTDIPRAIALKNSA